MRPGRTAPRRIAPSTAALDGRGGRKPIYTSESTASPRPDMFGHNVGVWQELMTEFAGRPNVHYLEVGIAQGGSALWMLENVLTSSSSSLTGVDVFDSPKWRQNVRTSGRSAAVTTLIGRSQSVLRALRPGRFDIIYIDGSHVGGDVLQDAVLAWSLLKPGGLMIFDDYCMDFSDIDVGGSPRPLAVLPKLAIDAFIATHGAHLDVVHQYYQVAIRRRATRRCPTSACTPIAGFAYDWQLGRLFSSTRAQVSLPGKEHSLLRSILRTGRLGTPGFQLTTAQKTSPHLRSLEERLGVTFESITNDRVVRIPRTPPSSP